jgi:hypothetical protein
MRLGRFKHQPTERKKYFVDYACWLDVDTDEKITHVAFNVEPKTRTLDDGSVENIAMTIDGVYIMPGETQFLYYISGGVNYVEYVATFIIDTDTGQTKEDEIVYYVEDV